jgi:nucleotide-binding universal stress UspA family protein
MNIRRVLFPTDFSQYNDVALEFASTVAAEAKALLYIVHVDDMRDLNVPIAISGAYESNFEIWDRSAVRQRLEQVLPTISDVQYTHQYLEGMPVDEIVKFAQRENIDLIVMASHGRTGLPRLLMGSIAEGVMRTAHCAVLIAKQPAGRNKPQNQQRAPVHFVSRQ